MTDPQKRTSEFVRGFFIFLESRQIRAAVLHGGADGFQGRLSDVDFVLDHESFAKLPALIDGYCKSSGWQLCQILRHETTASYHVCSAVDDPSCSVALDACSDYQRNGSIFLSAEDLLAERKALVWGGHGLSPTAELRYRFAKAAAKNKDSRASAAEFATYPDEARSNCREWLRTRWNITLPSWNAADVSQALSAFRKKSNPRPSLAHAGAIRRILSRVRHPTGLVVITGGSDHDTVANHLGQVFGHLYFRRVRKIGRFGVVDLRDVVTSTLIFVPELPAPLSALIPLSCQHHPDPEHDPDTQCRILASRLHRRCQRREGLPE